MKEFYAGRAITWTKTGEPLPYYNARGRPHWEKIVYPLEGGIIFTKKMPTDKSWPLVFLKHLYVVVLEKNHVSILREERTRTIDTYEIPKQLPELKARLKADFPKVKIGRQPAKGR